MAPDIIERFESVSFVYRSYHLPMPDQSINADSLNSQLPTARKEWWPATADSFTPGGYVSTVIHTTLAGIEPTTIRFLVRRATGRATDSRQ